MTQTNIKTLHFPKIFGGFNHAMKPRGSLELELGYPSGLYQCIFYTALLLHPTHIYAGFYYEMNEGGFMGVALYATSLNYWRFPVMKSYRRTIDMVVANTTIARHLYLSVYTPNRMHTTLPFLLGIGFYLLSFICMKKNTLKLQQFATACFTCL
jgi:hypothetical protein